MAQPTEHEENLIFAQFLDLKHVIWSHLQQETYTKSWSQKKIISQLVRKGVPDFIIIIPIDICRLEKCILLFVEMKRARKRLKNGKISKQKVSTSPEQEIWLESLNLVGDVEARVCEGANQAIEFVEKFLK